MKKIYYFLTALLITTAIAKINYAQSPLEFDQLMTIGGQQDQVIRDFYSDDEGNIWIYLFTESDELLSNDSVIGTQSSTYLLKYSSSGELEFSYDFKVEGEPSVVNPDNLFVFANEQMVCTGYFSGDLIFGDTTISRDETTGFICRFLPDGTPEAIQCHDISQKTSRSHDIVADAQNNLYLAGTSRDTMFLDQNQDTLIISSDDFKMPVWKYDTNFDLQWLKVFHADEDIPFSERMVLDQDMNIIIAAGFGGSNFYYDDQAINLNGNGHKALVKMTPNGEVSWVNFVNGESSSSYDVCVDQENNIYLLSSFSGTIHYHDQTFTQVGNSANQMYILALDEAGEFIWCNQTHSFAYGVSPIYPDRITAVGNDIFVTGSYKTKTYFDDYLLEKVCPNYERSDAFIAKLNITTNTYAWANGIFGNVLGGIADIPLVVDQEHHVTAASYYSGNAIFGDTLVPGYGGIDIVIARMNEVITGINPIENKTHEDISIYPNPASNQVFIETSGDLSGCLLNVQDISGKNTASMTLKNISNTLDISGFESGIYIFNIANAAGKTIHSVKVIRK